MSMSKYATRADYEAAQARHTPGPWKADPKRVMIPTAHGYVEGPLMSYLAGNQGTGPGMTVSIASERVADHHLCAAAPRMLAALELAYARLDDKAAKEEIGALLNSIHPSSSATNCIPELRQVSDADEHK